jgi:hypothetical protein
MRRSKSFVPCSLYIFVLAPPSFSLSRLVTMHLYLTHTHIHILSSFTALMPSGDHLNIINPPGLTVMRIAGGRYRVTAAHRVIWTWMNEFAVLTDPQSAQGGEHSNDDSVDTLRIGDLVSMIIVDVFETDNQGKLLSYCPTFDNRAIHKTHATTETLRKSSHKVMSMLGKAQKSQTASMIMKQALSMAQSVRQKVDKAVQEYQSPHRNAVISNQELDLQAEVTESKKFEQAMTAADEAAAMHSISGSMSYMGDDDMERHEV